MTLEKLQEYLQEKLPGVGVITTDATSNALLTINVFYKPLNIYLQVTYVENQQLFLKNTIFVLETEISKLIRYHELAAVSLEEFLFKVKETIL